MHRIDEYLGYLSKILSVVAAIAVVSIMVTMTADVAMRIWTGRSIPGAFELVETTVVIVAFLGLAYAERSDTNVRVTIVTSRLRARPRYYALILGNAVALAIVGIMAYASWGEWFSSFERGETRQGLVNFPLWPARLAVAVGLSALALELLLTVIRKARTTERTGQATMTARTNDGGRK